MPDGDTKRIDRAIGNVGSGFKVQVPDLTDEERADRRARLAQELEDIRSMSAGMELAAELVQAALDALA